ncbi:MAG: HAMP domain-containing histidine kinase [Rhodothermales bacterium]|nr:HAMP domain-containing histidine kinase [Rhodothermales bacterium]
MIQRLRLSSSAIRDAERRAAQGELARQVNHDIKNGLTPIRNVFSHMIDVARHSPDELASVLTQRQDTIESSMAYLATLSANYAKLSPVTQTELCNVNTIVGTVVDEHLPSSRIRFTACNDAEPMVLADPVSIRRISENLVDNALHVIDESGYVDVKVELAGDDPVEKVVRISVSDTGSGMSAATRDRIFEDFFTTKSDGTGLGLSIVRRLVLDSGGRISVNSELGSGSEFVVELPAE